MNIEDQADFTTVTEVPGVKATQSELSQIYTRYHWSGNYVSGKKVLEVACGSGIGLGYLVKCGATEVLGTDIEERNLKFAKDHYLRESTIRLEALDATSTNIEDSRYDVVINFEAIYYMENLAEALRESFRIITPGGAILISTVNSRWENFNPSPFSHWYPDALELKQLLINAGFEVEISLGFFDEPAGILGKVKSFIRRSAIRLNLIPETMKGKELLKRLFYGKLYPIPHELTKGSYIEEPLIPLSQVKRQSSYAFIYAEGKKPVKT